ncbi:MAG: ribose-5-phosphate isomerase RpiA [Gammaproteobacteria bacterium]
MENSNSEIKKVIAKKAFEYLTSKLHKDSILGIGTGSTTNFFIEELIDKNPTLKAIVSSSKASTQLLENAGLEVSELNDVGGPDFYVDGADEINERLEMIKGGGGALTREKIIAAASKNFICICDASKQVRNLGKFPLAIEVIPMARSYVARQIVIMGGTPEYRVGFLSDNGNQIIDVRNLKMKVPYEIEEKINNIPGVVANGIFSSRRADLLIVDKNGEPKILK